MTGLFGEQAEPFEPEPSQPVLVFDDQGSPVVTLQQGG